MTDPVVSEELLDTPARDLNETELALLLLHKRAQTAAEAEEEVEAGKRAERKEKRQRREAARLARVKPPFDPATQEYGYVVGIKGFGVFEVNSVSQIKKGTELVQGTYTHPVTGRQYHASTIRARAGYVKQPATKRSKRKRSQEDVPELEAQ